MNVVFSTFIFCFHFVSKFLSLQITFYEDVAVASLHILGRPNVDGDQVKTDQHFLEPTVEEAVSTLEEKLKKGSLKFNFGTAGSPIKIKVRLKSMHNYKRETCPLIEGE